MIPSMLDPEFENDEAPTPRKKSTTQGFDQTRSVITTNPRGQKNRMQLMNITKGASTVSDYNSSTYWVPQGSLLDSIGRKPKALGIKEYAWRGIPAENDSRRFTHHYDKKFLDE